MKHNRLKHEVDAPLEIINGWQFYTNQDYFIKTGLGRYEYNFLTREFKYNGKPIEMFPIIKTIAEWYEKDQKKHNINTSKIETALLKIDLRKTANSEKNRIPLFLHFFSRPWLPFINKIKLELSTEMIITTDEKLYLKKSGRGFL
jgi:hypothetical protein